MEVYAGLDLHSTNTYVAVIDERNKVLCRQRHRNGLPPVLSALNPFKEWWWNRPTTGTGWETVLWMRAVGCIRRTLQPLNSTRG
jgi:hypothetical protein